MLKGEQKGNNDLISFVRRPLRKITRNTGKRFMLK